MTNYERTTLYIGVTNNIVRRFNEHKDGAGSIFTSKYKLTDLLYCEKLPDIRQAIEREKQLKRWHQEWKWNLIKEANPDLLDISSGIY